ncbi:hypothetical protein JX265_011693 [Neoarthrinium moseri]|uniref:FAD-binding domain-containing protein n=1 Tax=Neoarthrinium moseri TaxID=1658444 RepID=A0A9Q0AJH6_9PEZI|nr:hypothetical protein JX265_011693 [Neoarthrinium moseri]
MNFHTSHMENEPFYSVPTDGDAVQQALPNTLIQIQPGLERAFRAKLQESPYCDLRCGCEVIAREATGSGIVATYRTQDNVCKGITGQWLVGADGKRGVVRKHFLEDAAGIRQVNGSYQYDGTWIAANLKITLPTPSSHPELPLWPLGYTPEDVFDLFWPKGWHFCSPPGKATAGGRFGPYKERLWRHEFEQGNWDDSMDAEKLLWEQLEIMFTRQRDGRYQPLPFGTVSFPKDCIEILRCHQFRFTHKVVNKWFHDRIILIGDAAHVFPPFGGQGIACGLRDAHQLAWRLFLLTRLPSVDRPLGDTLLATWERERTWGVKEAATITKMNGQLCNEGDTYSFWIFRLVKWISQQLPFIPSEPDLFLKWEQRGYRSVDGFHLKQYGGGGKIAQVYVDSDGDGPMLSDQLIAHTSIVTLLVISNIPQDLILQAKEVIQSFNFPKQIINDQCIRAFSSSRPPDVEIATETCFPTPIPDIGEDVREGYNESNFIERLLPNACFVLVRSDFYIFAQARTTEELVASLQKLKEIFILQVSD